MVRASDEGELIAGLRTAYTTYKVAERNDALTVFAPDFDAVRVTPDESSTPKGAPPTTLLSRDGNSRVLRRSGENPALNVPILNAANGTFDRPSNVFLV